MIQEKSLENLAEVRASAAVVLETLVGHVLVGCFLNLGLPLLAKLLLFLCHSLLQTIVSL
jgi:hypothetical protein